MNQVSAEGVAFVRVKPSVLEVAEVVGADRSCQVQVPHKQHWTVERINPDVGNTLSRIIDSLNYFWHRLHQQQIRHASEHRNDGAEIRQSSGLPVVPPGENPQARAHAHNHEDRQEYEGIPNGSRHRLRQRDTH